MIHQPRVFISYARKDGEDFATALRQRLEREEPEITLWQDRARMEGGSDWWKQITDALDVVEFMVLVMTPAAIQSPVVRKEWRYARQQGVCIYPVKGAPDAQLDFASLPRWMCEAHFYDLNREWATFVNHLKSPCHATRVPFMAPDLPAGFVSRTAELTHLRAAVVQAEQQNPIAGTTVLHGAGGFGKTTLAAALCHDDDVITAFDKGILWATLGERPDLREELTKLYAALTGERPAFVDHEDAAIQLAEKLADKSCLIVIDDVWDAAHLRPFLRGGKACTRLITTRNFAIAAEAQQRIDVYEMTPSEATQMLTARLDTFPTDQQPLRALARRLGEWPLLLELAGAALRQRMVRGDTVSGALDYLNRALDRRSVIAFDQREAKERNQAVARTITVSLELLSDDEREHYIELAIFPEDTDIPLTAVGALWKLDDFDTEELVQRLDDVSLLRFDLQASTIRLHDVLRTYLADQLADSASIHTGLIDAWGDLYRLPNAYAWRWIAYHLVKAGQTAKLRALLLDADWLHAKLAATDVTTLTADYSFLPQDREVQLVQGALQLSVQILAQDKTQLRGQLYGRLLAHQVPEIQALLAQARQIHGPAWLRPLSSSLTPAGDPLLCTLQGHADVVLDVAVALDGRRAVSASGDNTSIVWDLVRGVAEHTLAGHTCYVTAVAVTPDGQRAVSASLDGTLKVWDLERGAELFTLRGHTDNVEAVVVTLDGQRAISASRDTSLKVWDLQRGLLLQTLNGHSKAVRAVTLTHDSRRAISASEDTTLRVWDLANGAELHTLGTKDWSAGKTVIMPDGRRGYYLAGDGVIEVWDEERPEILGTLVGHANTVRSVAVTPDGRHAVSASWDGTLRVWDLEHGTELRVLQGHAGSIYVVTVTPDGQYAISGASDKTLRMWDLHQGAALLTLHGHASDIYSLAVTPDGRRVISGSADHTLRVWDLEQRTELLTLRAHTSAIRAVTLTPDGRRAISASNDSTLRVWDIESLPLSHPVSRHIAPVNAVAVTPDGRRAITAAGTQSRTQSDDNTLKVWDVENGLELHTLRGHRSYIWTVQVTPDGCRAISGSDDHHLKVWDLQRGVELATLSGHKDLVWDVRVTPDGRWAVSASSDHDLIVWDLERKVRLHTLSGHTEWINHVAITPDGQRAVSASSDFTLKVWDLVHGVELHTLRGHDKEAYAVVITSDGSRVLSGSGDNTVKVWDLAHGTHLLTLRGHTGVITDIAVAPDGRQAISGSGFHDHTLKVWDLTNGACVHTFYGHTSYITAVALVSGSRHAVSTSLDHTLKVWDLARGAVLATFNGESPLRACAVVPAIGPGDVTIVVGEESGRVHFLRLEGVG